MDTLIKSTKSPYILPGILSIDEIIASVFGVTVEGMKDRGRKRPNVEARQFAMYFRSRHTNDSYDLIGSMYSGKDHATVTHAVKTVKNLIETNKPFRELVKNATDALDKAGYINHEFKRIIKTKSYEREYN